ncbi:MAG: polysaccharide biosynthesis tyrosine autokinase [Desulfobulbaceae bacterium]
MGKVSRALNKAETGITQGDNRLSPSDNEEGKSVSAPAEPSVRKSTPAPPVINTNTDGSLENWDERLRSSSENLSGIAESFRKLRTLILHPENEKPAQSILILSAEPQEGKSFVCANLGISIANDVNRKALLVDCDLRRPNLHNLFGMKCPKGLSDLLRGKEEDISSLIFATGLPNLSIIPSGPPPNNPSELVSGKMANVIRELTNRYDDRLLILDSPPFQAAAEALILSQLVDKIILVVRWGKADREVIKKMRDSVGQEKIIGVVFNAFEMNILDKKMQGVGYHNYYSESYY